MDDWPAEQQQRHNRNKRTFTQMSQLLPPLQNHNSFLSSSPHPPPDPRTFGSPSNNFFNMPPRVGPPQHHPNSNPPENMAHRRLPMPSLQQQPNPPSRTFIDLTHDDADAPSSQGRRSSQRSVAPPQLERSDSISLGAEIISIDSDEDDIEFVSERQIPGAQARPQNRTQAAPVPAQIFQHAHHQDPVAPRLPRENNGGLFAIGGAIARFREGIHRHHIMRDILVDPRFNGAEALFLGQINGPQPRMPGQMDYDLHPFAARQEAAREKHQPPPPAREGFTRSPKEDDVIVCPACDEELMVDPSEVEPAPEKKPSLKKKSKADRAEHPFWVVKECGHVYCNKCYQNRRPDIKSSKRLFPEKPPAGSRKTPAPICAVDNCDSEVGDKRSWVGVFL